MHRAPTRLEDLPHSFGDVERAVKEHRRASGHRGREPVACSYDDRKSRYVCRVPQWRYEPAASAHVDPRDRVVVSYPRAPVVTVPVAAGLCLGDAGTACDPLRTCAACHLCLEVCRCDPHVREVIRVGGADYVFDRHPHRRCPEPPLDRWWVPGDRGLPCRRCGHRLSGPCLALCDNGSLCRCIECHGRAGCSPCGCDWRGYIPHCACQCFYDTDPGYDDRNSWESASSSPLISPFVGGPGTTARQGTYWKKSNGRCVQVFRAYDGRPGTYRTRAECESAL